MLLDKSSQEATEAVQMGDYGGQVACLCKTYSIFLSGTQRGQADLT